jgi:hypothetical protein
VFLQVVTNFVTNLVVPISIIIVKLRDKSEIGWTYDRSETACGWYFACKIGHLKFNALTWSDKARNKQFPSADISMIVLEPSYYKGLLKVRRDTMILRAYPSLVGGLTCFDSLSNSVITSSFPVRVFVILLSATLSGWIFFNSAVLLLFLLGLSFLYHGASCATKPERQSDLETLGKETTCTS